MKSGHWTSGVYNIAEWVMRLVYLNVLWMVFTLCGLVVFTVFPATTAMFAVTRHWVRGSDEIAVFTTFWKEFKASFKTSQIAGFAMVIAGLILYADFRYFFPQEGLFFLVVKVVLGSAIFVFIVSSLFLFPLLAHFQLKTFVYIKNAFLISISHVFHSIFMILGTVLLVYALLNYAGAILIAGFSLVAYWNTWIAQMAFRRIGKVKSGETRKGIEVQ